MKNEQKFSVKKLLLTVITTIIVTNFIFFTVYFILNSFEYAILNNSINNPETVRKIDQSWEKQYNQMEKYIQCERQMYGEDYPAGGFMLYSLIIRSEGRLAQLYINSLLIGTIIGIILYAVAIQKVRGFDLIIELVVAFIILLSLIFIINLSFEIIGIGEIFDYFDNMQLTIISLIIFVIVYIAEMIHQKTLAKKMNEELEMKK